MRASHIAPSRPARPASRWPRLVAYLGILAAVATALCASGILYAYGSPGRTDNGGVALGDCYHFNVGIELWGHPGVFYDQC
jgi:hypothetical protein